MPRYVVTHVAPLTQAQQDALALAITEIHSRLFTTPRLFVNVSFVDGTRAPTYVAGRPVRVHASLDHRYDSPPGLLKTTTIPYD